MDKRRGRVLLTAAQLERLRRRPVGPNDFNRAHEEALLENERLDREGRAQAAEEFELRFPSARRQRQADGGRRWPAYLALVAILILGLLWLFWPEKKIATTAKAPEQAKVVVKTPEPPAPVPGQQPLKVEIVGEPLKVEVGGTVKVEHSGKVDLSHSGEVKVVKEVVKKRTHAVQAPPTEKAGANATASATVKAESGGATAAASATATVTPGPVQPAQAPVVVQPPPAPAPAEPPVARSVPSPPQIQTTPAIAPRPARKPTSPGPGAEKDGLIAIEGFYLEGGYGVRINDGFKEEIIDTMKVGGVIDEAKYLIKHDVYQNRVYDPHKRELSERVYNCQKRRLIERIEFADGTLINRMKLDGDPNPKEIIQLPGQKNPIIVRPQMPAEPPKPRGYKHK